MSVLPPHMLITRQGAKYGGGVRGQWPLNVDSPYQNLGGHDDPLTLFQVSLSYFITWRLKTWDDPQNLGWPPKNQFGGVKPTPPRIPERGTGYGEYKKSMWRGQATYWTFPYICCKAFTSRGNGECPVPVLSQPSICDGKSRKYRPRQRSSRRTP